MCKYKYGNKQQPAVKAKRCYSEYPNIPEKVVVKTKDEANKNTRGLP